MRIIVTAGPTREHLDPVRFLTNPSTGKMGFAIAKVAAEQGLMVSLITGPVSLPTPKGVQRIEVISAREMLKAVEAEVLKTNEKTVLIATAAVADWRPKTCAKVKLKKDKMSSTLVLTRNPDILKTIGRKYRLKRPLKLIGFAAETNDVLSEAARKCKAKGLEMIVANDVTEKGAGFGSDTNRVTFLRKNGTTVSLPLMTKLAVAKAIIKEAKLLWC